MITYLVNFIHAFFPVSLLTGMLLALWLPVYGKRALRPVIVSLATGLSGGTIIYLVARSQEILTAAQTSLYGAAMMAALCHAAILLPAGRKFRSLYRIGWGAAWIFLASPAAAARSASSGLPSLCAAIAACRVTWTSLSHS